MVTSVVGKETEPPKGFSGSSIDLFAMLSALYLGSSAESSAGLNLFCFTSSLLMMIKCNNNNNKKGTIKTAGSGSS
jgi:hypothetical protein